MAVKQLTSNNKILGLQTNPSILSASQGALQIADNIMFNRDGMAEGRRGFTYHTNHTSRVSALIDYQDRLIIAESDGSVSVNDPSTSTTVPIGGTWLAPSGSVNRGVDARGNLYMTSARGVVKKAGTEAPFRLAGMPPGLDLSATVTGTSGFLPAGKAVNYRMIWTTTDTNGVTVRGAPAPLTKVANAGSSAVNVTVAFSVPQNIASGDKWELYRSAASLSEPSDDLYLVKSGVWTAGAEITVTDDILEDYLITPLYTNAEDGDGGIIAGNWIVPISHEIEVFKDFVFLGRTATSYFKEVRLISVSGVTANSSNITISDGSVSRTYTFSSAENFAANKFKLSTSGTPSQNIEATAKSLCRCINQDAAGKWWAIYTSSIVDDPGIIQLMARDIDGASFSITSNYGTIFDPTIPATGTTVSASQDDKKNRIYYSKIAQPEHFPLVNFLDVGRADKAILGLRALKDSLFIIKEDGVFYLSGGNPSSASLVTLDSTTFCVAPRSITKLNNELYFLSNQGIVRVSENGAAVISNEIENLITELLFFDNIKICIGSGIERDRVYMLWVPTSENDETPQIAYVYNIFRQQWSRMTKSASAAISLGNRFFIGSGRENVVLKMRDSRTESDWSDEELSITIVSINEDIGIIFYGYAHEPLTAGFSVHQGGNTVKIVEIIEKAGSNYTVRFNGVAGGFVTGPATVRIPIRIAVRHLPNTAIAAGVTKTFLDFGFVLDRNTVSLITLDVTGNENGEATSIEVRRVPDAGWGDNPWGFGLWGAAGTERSVPVRENVPVQHTLSEWLTIGIKHAVSGERFALIHSYVTYQISTDVTATVDVTGQ